MSDVLAIEINELTVRAALVGDDGMKSDVREFIGTVSVDDQIDRAKVASTWLGTPSAMPAVVSIECRVDYWRERPMSEESRWSGLTADRLSDQLGQPAVLAGRTDLLAVGEAQLGSGVGHRTVAFLRLGERSEFSVVGGGRLIQPTRDLGTIDRAVSGPRRWMSLAQSEAETIASLVDQYRPDVLVLSDGSVPDRVRLRSALAEPGVLRTGVDIVEVQPDRDAALRASAGWIAARRADVDQVPVGSSQHVSPWRLGS